MTTQQVAISEVDLESIRSIRSQFARLIVGQQQLIDRLLLALIADGHVLIEGVPGLGKTLAVTTLAKAVQLLFHRIQFTPDLLPADLIGTLIFDPESRKFEIRKGPVFANIILADEINRAPAKVQSALLEAMQERQVTIGGETYPLEDPFLVLATQNPIEQEGTYSLPEAQVDRFMLKLAIGYPDKDDEVEILRRMGRFRPSLEIDAVMSAQDILRLRQTADEIYLDEKIERYIVTLVDATRNPARYGLKIGNLIRYGASPRGTIALARAGKAEALLRGRPYVSPQDVKAIALDVLRHRVAVSYEAEAQGQTSDDLLSQILNTIPAP
jgi:MoxR-like ATPase